eukprot:s694_g5.t1
MKARHRGLILLGLLCLTSGVKRFEENLPDPHHASPTWPVGHGRGSGVVISLLETHAVVTEEVKNEIQELFSGVAQSLSNVRHFDSYLNSLATALISLSEKVRGPYLQSPLSEILKVIDKTLKPGILDQHAAAQQAITRADQSVVHCYHTLWRSLNQSNAILQTLTEKRKAIKSCHSSAAADSAAAATALLSLPRFLTARASDCESLLAASNAREAPLEAWAARCDHHDGSSVGTYLMKQLMHWEDLLQRYDDIEKRCKESTSSYETQVLRRGGVGRKAVAVGSQKTSRIYSMPQLFLACTGHQHDGADCRPLQVDMDEAACQQALDRIESCGTYDSCIKESIADRAVLHTSQCKLEVNLKAQWYALESMKCLLKSYEDHGGSEDSGAAAGLALEICNLQGCDDIKADVADALNSTHSSSKTSRACAITKDPQKDPSLPGNATTVSMERSNNGTCTKLLDGRQRWVARLAPAPGTPEADLKEFGLALELGGDGQGALLRPDRGMKAVLDLWPEDEQDLKRWAQAIQAEAHLRLTLQTAEAWLQRWIWSQDFFAGSDEALEIRGGSATAYIDPYCYRHYKRRLLRWVEITMEYLPGNEQALRALENLKGEAEVEMEEIDDGRYNVENGIELLLRDLERSFGAKELFRQRGTIREFVGRLQGESVHAFVRRFRLFERN